MSIQPQTIKRLFAKSNNQCAMPKCPAPIVIGDTVVGDICHIKARSKKGPRFDASLTAVEKDSFGNLILLCKTCHKLIDSDPEVYPPEWLTEIKEFHENNGPPELTPAIARGAELLMASIKKESRATAVSRGGVAVAVGRDNNAPIHIHVPKTPAPVKSKYPPNSIGADTNLVGYIEYLLELAYKYWQSVPDMDHGRIGNKIKRKFRLGKRTRYHLGVQRFANLVDFIVGEILLPSPAGKRHLRQGTKVCRSFDEWRHGDM